MNSRWIGIVIFIIVVMTVVRFMPSGCERREVEMAELRVLDLGDERIIRIKGRGLMRGRQGYYYQVEQDGEVVREPTFFGTLPPGTALLHFTWHASADGSLVAIATETYPNEILILHDFATSESWPAHDGEEMVEAFQMRGRSLLARFVRERSEDATKAFTVREAEFMRPLPPPIEAPKHGRGE